MAERTTTYRAFANTFADFLTVAIHTILYERRIYPQTSFLSARRYNYAVRQSRHPKVCEWINDAVASAEVELLKGSVDRVALVIYNPANKPLERFVFDVSSFPVVAESDVDTPLEQRDENGDLLDVLPTVDLEEQLRATMSRLANCGSTLRPLPPRCTFTLAIELKNSGHNAPLSHPQPWIPAQQGQDHARSRSGTDNPASKHVTPVRAVQAGDMIFEAWIEEVKDEQTKSTDGSTTDEPMSQRS